MIRRLSHINCWVLYSIIIILSGCGLEISVDDSVFQPSQNVGSSWSFEDPSQYSFSTDFIEVNNGSARLREVNQIQEGADFTLGQHHGTTYDASSEELILITKTADSITTPQILSDRNESLIAYWPMDNDGLDASGSIVTHDLTNAGGAYATDGKIGSHAVSYSGGLNSHFVDDHQDFDFSNGQRFTVSMWYRTDSQGLTERLIGQVCHDSAYVDSSWGFVRWNTDNVQFAHFENGVTQVLTPMATGILQIGGIIWWHHMMDRS